MTFENKMVMTTGSQILICGRNTNPLLVIASYAPAQINAVVADKAIEDGRHSIREALTSVGPSWIS